MKRTVGRTHARNTGLSWYVLRLCLLGVVFIFFFNRLLTYITFTPKEADGVNQSVRMSLKRGYGLKDRAIQFQYGRGTFGRGGSLSGSNIFPDDVDTGGNDIDENPTMEDFEFAEAREHPKVALMFLTKGEIHTEPIWRSFLENAAKLKLKAKALKTLDLSLERIVNGQLHTPISQLEETRYPGYKIQHGLVPPSKYRSTEYPHVKRRLLMQDRNMKEVIRPGEQSEDEEEGEGEAGQKPTRGKTGTLPKIAISDEEWMNGTTMGCRGEEIYIAAESKKLLSDDRPGPEIYSSQDFFSIYVHASPGFKFPKSSLFYGLEIPNPVNCTNAFALHTLVEAEFKLLEMALSDVRNQKLVLLSEACIPVHPPEVVYAQVIHEPKSRINACLSMDPGRLELWRWKQKMETSHLNQQYWRKSQQWYILSRSHAKLVVADKHVKEVFKRYCWSYGKHICVSDEHYIPTLLASYGLDHQTDCLGEGTWTNWSAQGWHPKTFEEGEVSPKLFKLIAKSDWPPCDPVAARQSALELFEFDKDPVYGQKSGIREMEDFWSCIGERLEPESLQLAHDHYDSSPEDWISGAGYLPLGYECPLFARKFSAAALPETINSTLSCSGAALGPWCRNQLLISSQ